MTPVQARMARAAVQQTTREVADAIGVSAQTISKIERGVFGVQPQTIAALENHYTALGVSIGPPDTISYYSEHGPEWLSVALLQLLGEIGPIPTSQELILAHRRATSASSKEAREE